MNGMNGSGKKLNQGLINHIALVVDASGSIEHRRLTEAIATVADNQIKHLAARSSELDPGRSRWA